MTQMPGQGAALDSHSYWRLGGLQVEPVLPHLFCGGSWARTGQARESSLYCPPSYLRIWFLPCCVSIKSGMFSKKIFPKLRQLRSFHLFKRYLLVMYFWPSHCTAPVRALEGLTFQWRETNNKPINREHKPR